MLYILPHNIKKEKVVFNTTYLNQLLIICPLVFLAGLIDSIAGGGGLISLPAYSVAMPTMAGQFILGTNKFSSVWGSLISSIKFIKSGKIHKKSLFISILMGLVGSFIGARLALAADKDLVGRLLLYITPVLAIFILTKKDLGDEIQKNYSDKKIIILAGLICFFIGMYDGFYGPGTGTFLIIAFTSILGFDIVTASGNAKLVNLASNFAAIITFIVSGKVIYSLAIPAALCSIFGSYIGATIALKNGKKIIKPVFILVLTILLITVYRR